MTEREIMLRCTGVNRDYMRLPAGQVTGLTTLTELYQRMASQSVECAHAWVSDQSCPSHEPAVDAFWWGVVAWADAFGQSIKVEKGEWHQVFIVPHLNFAAYLKDGNHLVTINPVSGTAGEIIMELDARWMELVIRLTMQWGLLHHLKDRQALVEAKNLDALLRVPGSLAFKAYLESDLVFFRELFKNFQFSPETTAYLRDWLLWAESS